MCCWPYMTLYPAWRYMDTVSGWMQINDGRMYLLHLMLDICLHIWTANSVRFVTCRFDNNSFIIYDHVWSVTHNALMIPLLKHMVHSQFYVFFSLKILVVWTRWVHYCSLLRYRLNVFLTPLPKVGGPIFLEIQNPWGKIMQGSGLIFEYFCLEVV